MVQFGAHRLAPGADTGRREANREFQQHSCGLTEMRSEHNAYPLFKAGWRTTQRERDSASFARATSNPSEVNR